MLDTLWQDSRHAIRALRNDPGFAAVTALSLALGIGANTAIFSLIDAVMLKALPVSHPEELLQVTAGGGGGGYLSNLVWEEIRDRQDTFSGIPPTVYTVWSRNHFPFPNIEIRPASGPPGALIAGVKNAVASVDAGTSIKFTTLANEMAATLQRERLLATLAGFFGGLALLLAVIGLYGVMSYNVTRRRSEIGIRMALGAEKYQVLRMVMGEVAVLIGSGIALGLGVTLAAARLVASFLYGVRPNDPLTLFVAAGMLSAAAGAAGYLPARRVSRLDPMTSLREE